MVTAAERRARQGKTARAGKTTSVALKTAIDFVSFAQRDMGPAYMRHCVLYDGWVYAFDGILSAGHKIDEHLTAAPQTEKLLLALSHCSEQMSLTHTEPTLAVKSGKFRAVIPCLDMHGMPYSPPDEPRGVANDQLRVALACVAPLASDGAEFIVTAAILLDAGRAVATNRHVLIEYWHGIDLPRMLVPKIFAKELIRINKPITQFGFSGNTFTVYFEDGSWIKTQLYECLYPDFESVLNADKINPWPVLPGFFEAVDILLPFSVGKYVAFDAGVMRTEDNATIAAASYEVEGLPAGYGFDPNHLKLIAPYAKTMDLGPPRGEGNLGNLRFFGDNVRGAVCQKRNVAT